MLSYEPGEINRYGLTFARLRLELLKLVQSKSLKRASGAIFLTKHALKVIQNIVVKLKIMLLLFPMELEKILETISNPLNGHQALKPQSNVYMFHQHGGLNTNGKL